MGETPGLFEVRRDESLAQALSVLGVDIREETEQISDRRSGFAGPI